MYIDEHFYQSVSSQKQWSTCQLCVPRFWLVSLVQSTIGGGVWVSAALVAAGTYTICKLRFEFSMAM